MTKKKLKTYILNIAGKQKKLRLNDSVFDIYIGLLSQNFLS